MAYREVGMVHVREIVRRWLAGDGLRSIARALGVDRKTVAEYVRLAHAAGIARGGAPPSEAQFVALAACRRPGRPAATTEPSAEVRALVAHQEMIRRWLSEDAHRLTKVYRRLRAQGVAVSYSTLYRCHAHAIRCSPCLERILFGGCSYARMAQEKAFFGSAAPLEPRPLDDAARTLKPGPNAS